MAKPQDGGGDKDDDNKGRVMLLTIPSWGDPSTEYRVSLRSRPALWSKFAKFLGSQRQTKETKKVVSTQCSDHPSKEDLEYLQKRQSIALLQEQCFGSVASDYSDDDASLLSYHYHQGTVNINTTTNSSTKNGAGDVHPIQYVSVPRHLESNLSLEECWAETASLTPSCKTPNNAEFDIELELASIQALRTRDDETTDSEKQLLEQLVLSSRKKRAFVGQEEEDDTTEEDEDFALSPSPFLQLDLSKNKIKTKTQSNGEDTDDAHQEAITLPSPATNKSDDPANQDQPDSGSPPHHHQIPLTLQRRGVTTPQFQNVFQEFMYYYRWVVADMRAQDHLFRHDHTAHVQDPTNNTNEHIVTYFQQTERDANNGPICNLLQEFWYYYPMAIEKSMDQLGR
ncbi:expressed unknown protein [Seminavis robusta]|uniref:Uncharacterized protein n=1 Tax=Seminavis robusta TaxID=568900 RepID=A0A9N8HPI4_9STRA|nr:expressed unknown protein [Seminavis robusta]|eukprot:Sro1071_g237960.1 n/a (397) ;mRNA; r:23803-24993